MTECPGCGGEKTPRSKLCRSCRRRAIDVGVAAVIRARAERDVEHERQLTPGQLRAFYGKATALAEAAGWSKTKAHDVALEDASRRFARVITSVKQLDVLEANEVLDWMEAQTEAIKLAEVDVDELAAHGR